MTAIQHPIGQRVSPVTLWVILCTLLNAAGWLLSAAGQLNVTGYVAFFAASMPFFVCWILRTRPLFYAGFRLRRFKRAFPLAFAILAVLAVVGGILHPPANYDALAYRTPRVLHWLAAEQWHWIHTDFQRLNTRGSGIEWLTAPLILLTGSDRLIFVINAVSFLLLPGLCFRVLTGLGVGNKVAWHWMWIIPGSYCYVLQAGSIANDLMGATLALAAVDFALRAARRRAPELAALSILAAALMTAGKGFNLLFLLPWGLALLPATMAMLRRPVLMCGVGLVAALVSLVPTSILNSHYCGDWKGLRAEPVRLASGEPGFHLAVNIALLTLHHLNPPVSPFAGAWNAWTSENLPQSWKDNAARYFEPSAVTFKLGEMEMEESTGLGFGVCLMLLSVVIGRHRLQLPCRRDLLLSLLRPAFLVPAGALFSTLYFLSQSGLGCPDRYLAPFYVLLIAPLLRLPRAAVLLGKSWWRRLALVTFGFAAILLIITPPRPLWPVQTLLKALQADQSNSPLVRRIWTVYSVYGARSDGFEPVRKLLPPSLEVLGLVSFDDPETSLWRPFGGLRIKHVSRKDDAESLGNRGITRILVSEYTLQSQNPISMTEWLRQFNSEITDSFDLSLRAGRGPTRWHLVRLRSTPQDSVQPDH